MVERQVEIVNKSGLHARAAAKLVHLGASFECDIHLLQDGEKVDAKSILGILLLAAAQGTRLAIRCDGSDEDAALSALEKLIADRFGEQY